MLDLSFIEFQPLVVQGMSSMDLSMKGLGSYIISFKQHD